MDWSFKIFLTQIFKLQTICAYIILRMRPTAVMKKDTNEIPRWFRNQVKIYKTQVTQVKNLETSKFNSVPTL